MQLAKDPVLVSGDAAQLCQVLVNLLLNASDAIGAKKGVITISTGKPVAARVGSTATFWR